MTVIKIETVQLRLISGETANVTGIDSTSADSLDGYVHFTSGERVQVSWDIFGRARDKDQSFNFSPQSMDTAEFDDLKETTLHLVVARVKNQLGFA